MIRLPPGCSWKILVSDPGWISPERLAPHWQEFRDVVDPVFYNNPAITAIHPSGRQFIRELNVDRLREGH